jgi:beta-lactamase regulating signal transducer with metallopeptidase domain
MISYLAASIAADLLLKASVVLLVAWIATRSLWWTSAAIRHAIWCLAFLALMVLPALERVLPSWGLDSLVSQQTVAPSETASPTVPVVAEVAVSAQVPPAPAPPPAARPPIEALLFGGLLLWMGGAALILGRLALHARRASQLTARGSPASSELMRSLSAASLALGARRRIRAVVSNEIPIPASWGIVRPVILLPAGAESWPRERLHAVLTHEIAHIARHDYVLHLLGELARALYWVNPLIWIAARRSAMERERACDDVAVRSGVERDAYASRLLEIARLQLSPPAATGALAMAERSGLAERVRGILNRTTNRSPVGAARLAVIAVAAALVAVPVAAFQITQDRPPSIAQLLEDLKSDDVTVARRAAWWLGEREDWSTVDAVIDAIRRGHPDVQLAAAWALGEIKDPRAINSLAELLDSGDPLLREMATLSLGEIESPEAVPTLIAAYEADATLGTAVIWALGEIDSDEAEAAQYQTAKELGRPLGTHEQVWIGPLDVKWDAEVSQSASQLIRALQSSSTAATRRLAARDLGLLGEFSAVDPLLDAMRDPDPMVRSMAVWALDEINPSRK